LRWALLGSKPGSTVFKVMEVLGKEETYRRLMGAADVADEVHSQAEDEAPGL
jgi:hypothetical protein